MQPLEHASNAELLAKLAGKAAAEALAQNYGGLTELAKASFDELQNVKGIGESKAAAIKSAFLLAQRLSREAYPESTVLDTPERIAGLLREQNLACTVENFQVVFLNTRRRLIGVQNISQGTLDTLLVHPREVFSAAISIRVSLARLDRAPHCCRRGGRPRSRPRDRQRAAVRPARSVRSRPGSADGTGIRQVPRVARARRPRAAPARHRAPAPGPRSGSRRATRACRDAVASRRRAR